jgi:hypothetical protein
MRAHLGRPTLPDAEVWQRAAEAGVLVDLPDVWPLMPADHPLRRRQCDAKHAYLHLEMAVTVAVWRSRSSLTQLRVYPCPWGLHWHLTSKNKHANQSNPR